MINKIFASSAEKMLIDFESYKVYTHAGTKGRLREHILVEHLLEDYLPKRYGVGSGIIVDINGSQSLQQDLMIFDIYHAPILVNTNSEKILFPETVYSVIEVKSVLKTDDIGDMVRKSFSVWNLERHGKPGVLLDSRMGVDLSQSPPLCLGFAFKSEVKIADIPKYIRRYQSEEKSGIALSVICVLSDQNNDSGLILNVDLNNLTRPRMIPTENTRLAIIKSKTKGDVLLLFYLMLMEHLRISSMHLVYPDLEEYAKQGGLMKDMELGIDAAESSGGSIPLEGALYNVDVFSRLSDLNQKMFKYHNISDKEIIEFYYLLPQIPAGKYMLEANSKFFVDGKPLDVKTPIEFHHAAKRFLENKPQAGDSELLNQLVDIIRSIGKENRTLLIGTRTDRHSENGATG